MKSYKVVPIVALVSLYVDVRLYAFEDLTSQFREGTLSGTATIYEKAQPPPRMQEELHPHSWGSYGNFNRSLSPPLRAI